MRNPPIFYERLSVTTYSFTCHIPVRLFPMQTIFPAFFIWSHSFDDSKEYSKYTAHLLLRNCCIFTNQAKQFFFIHITNFTGAIRTVNFMDAFCAICVKNIIQAVNTACFFRLKVLFYIVFLTKSHHFIWFYFLFIWFQKWCTQKIIS